MRRHLRRLRHDGGIDIADAITLGLNQPENVAQQDAAIGALEGGVGIGKMPADVAKRRGAEQRITKRMQQHVAVGVGQQARLVGNLYAAEGNERPLAETVNIVAVANTHRGHESGPCQ